jgi:hypothetical protein
MRIPKPAWRAPRRLVAAAVLAAVFATGWYLGQPVVPSRCEVSAVPVRYSDYLAADRLQGCADRSRLLAWLAGDFR